MANVLEMNICCQPKPCQKQSKISAPYAKAKRASTNSTMFFDVLMQYFFVLACKCLNSRMPIQLWSYNCTAVFLTIMSWSHFLWDQHYISSMFHLHHTLNTINLGTSLFTLIHLPKSHKEHISFLYVCSLCHKLTVWILSPDSRSFQQCTILISNCRHTAW